MITYYTHADLVSFGRYLLSEERNANISEAGKGEVNHADIKNWKDQLPQTASPEAVSFNGGQ